jgi:histidyl-tRNA synthetase
METCSLLWKNDIKAETLYVDNPRTDKTFSYAFDNGIPLILIIGEQEIEKGIYKVKALNENKEYEFKSEELISGIKNLIKANPILLSK